MPTDMTICVHCGVRTDPDRTRCENCFTRPVPRLSEQAALAQTWPLAIASARRCFLTARDSTILEGMVGAGCGPDEHVRSLLGMKLGNARVVLTADVDADVVTLDSRVCFRTAGDPAAERVVTAWEGLQTPGLTIGVTTPLGATLLGMRPGDPGWIVLRDGTARSIEVVDVAYQPEAADRRARRERSEKGTLVRLPAARRKGAGHASGDDDPGPSAA